MGNRVFLNKQFSNYLGEQRAILDIIVRNESAGVPSPTPTPSITPTITVTPTVTVTPTLTRTPTPTPSTVGPDPDANAYLSAVVGAGGTGITPTVSAATQTLFTSLKSAGIYSKLYALYPMLGGNQAGCKWNAIDPRDLNAAYRLGGGTYSSKGLVGNGSSVNAETYFNPTTAGVATDSFAMFAYISVSGSTGYDMGAATLNAWYGLATNATGSFQGQVEDTGQTSISATGGTLGFQAVSRTTSAGLDWIRDGGAVNNFVRASGGGIPNRTMLLGVYGGVGLFTNRSIGTCGFASGLDATQLGDLRDIINTFESALTR